MAKVLTIREANRLARGRARVTVNPEDGRLWQVQRPGSVQAHEPMTREAWLEFLKTGTAAPRPSEQTAADVYAERQRDIERLLEWLTQELGKNARQAKAEPKDWSRAGDLYRVRRGLVELVAALRGAEIEDIERHL
jgi:histone H3/H4